MTSPIKTSKHSADTLEKYKGKTRDELLIELQHLEGAIQCASVDIWAGTVTPLDELISLLNLSILHLENQGVAMENQGFNKTLIVDSLSGIKRGLIRVWCDAIDKCEELEGCE